MNIAYLDLIIVFIICYLIIGTVAWYRHRISEQVLGAWWDASMDPYETNPIKRYVATCIFLS